MYTVVYLRDGGDLCYEEFPSLEEAQKYVEEDIQDAKAHIIEGKHFKDCT